MADGFESTIVTSGGILSLMIIPIIMFTVTCCAIKKKANSKVVFIKDEGTFKVIIIPPPNDLAEDAIKDKLKQNQSNNPNCNESHIYQLSESPLMPKRYIQSNWTVDHTASISSDVIITPNPSYNVAKSNDKFTLSESLYIYCEQPSTDEEEKIPSEKQLRVNEGRKECDKALYGARATSCDDRAAQTFKDSIIQTATAAREECDNALYEARDYKNALYAGDNVPMNTAAVNNGRQECDNALYEAREYCDSPLHTGDDVTMNPNPSYNIMHTVPQELTFQNSYEHIATQTYEGTIQHTNCKTNAVYEVRECDNALYIGDHVPALTRSMSYDYVPPQTFEDSAQQVMNDGSRKECNNALYETREYQNIDDDHVPSNPDPKAVLTRSTSQNSYDYIYEAYDDIDDATHDYSLIDSVKVSDTLYHDQLTTEGIHSNVAKRGYQNPSYGHKVTMLGSRYN